MPTGQYLLLGDLNWKGVNERLDPGQLPAGFAARAINMRFRNGVPQTRKGLEILPWCNYKYTDNISASVTGSVCTVTTTKTHDLESGEWVTVSGLTNTDCNGRWQITDTGANTFTFIVTTTAGPAGTGRVVQNGMRSWGTIHGVGVYSDIHTRTDYLIIAAGGKVYAMVENNTAWEMTLPTGITLTGSVTFTQAFDRLIMHRGFDLPALELSRITAAWTEVGQALSSDGRYPIPNAERSIFYTDRIWLAKPGDEIAVSDYGDYTRYQPVVDELKINTGSSDSVVALYKYSETTVIVFKERSIYALYNAYGDLKAIQQDLVTDQYGCIAPRSIVQIGADLWFLSQLGVCSLRQTEQNKIQGVVQPISEPMQPVIDRVNWRYASQAAAAYWDSKFYLSLPLDAAEAYEEELVPNALTEQVFSVTGFLIEVVAGARYRWIKGDATSLDNGGTVYTTDKVFTAAGATVTLTCQIGSPNGPSLKRLYEGALRHVLVYDFLNGAWSGYDDLTDVRVQDFVRFNYNGQQRLFLVGADGYVRLYEYGYEDALVRPYADLEVLELPTLGDFLQVNHGAIITTADAIANGTDTWGIDYTGETTGLPLAREKLYYDAVSMYGYASTSTANGWTAPNTYPLAIENGMRFISNNGICPNITVTADQADHFRTSRVARRPISVTFRTRGYTLTTGDLGDVAYIEMELRTWDPCYSVTMRGDGVNETLALLTAETRDRSEWFSTFAQAAYSEANPNDDQQEPYREDYSVRLGGAGPTVIDMGVNGLGLDLWQRYRHRFEENRLSRGYTAQIELGNATGQVRIMGVRLAVEPVPALEGARNVS